MPHSKIFKADQWRIEVATIKKQVRTIACVNAFCLKQLTCQVSCLSLIVVHCVLVSKFNDDSFHAESDSAQDVADGKATMAVVSVHFVTEGEDISHFKNMRADVVNLLRWTAATIPVASLVAGEVLWSPQSATDILRKQDIDERYPELTPLI